MNSQEAVIHPRQKENRIGDNPMSEIEPERSQEKREGCVKKPYRKPAFQYERISEGIALVDCKFDDYRRRREVIPPPKTP